jgi:hypothetical protein
MADIFEVMGVIFGFLGIILFLSPVIISAITGNWWYMFLFAVTWIPGIGCIMIASSLFD